MAQGMVAEEPHGVYNMPKGNSPAKLGKVWEVCGARNVRGSPRSVGNGVGKVLVIN